MRLDSLFSLPWRLLFEPPILGGAWLRVSILGQPDPGAVTSIRSVVVPHKARTPNVVAAVRPISALTLAQEPTDRCPCGILLALDVQEGEYYLDRADSAMHAPPVCCPEFRPLNNKLGRWTSITAAAGDLSATAVCSSLARSGGEPSNPSRGRSIAR